MSGLSVEEPPRGSLSNEDEDAAFRHGRKISESDASSLASLLEDGLEETGPTARLQPFDTVEMSLDPQNWPRRKKMFVAVTIAFYT